MNSKATASKTIGYDCKDCNQVLYLTPIQILKHKKQHSTSSSSSSSNSRI